MPKFFAPADDPADWQSLLAKPDLHWKTGYSARSMAYSWTEARGFPSKLNKVSGHCCPINFIRRPIEIEGLAALVQEDLRVAAPTGPFA